MHSLMHSLPVFKVGNFRGVLTSTVVLPRVLDACSVFEVCTVLVNIDTLDGGQLAPVRLISTILSFDHGQTASTLL